MRVLVTGGAGFIGRWVVDRYLKEGHEVCVIDNFSNSSMDNIREMEKNPLLEDVVEGDIRNVSQVENIFRWNPDICIHLAAKINVQESLDDPKESLDVDVLGTFNILEQCRFLKTKLIFISTCMVYDAADMQDKISEFHNTKPASPYAAVKLAAEKLVESYYHSYGVPITILRPFNTYGPYQKCNSEGGVVAIFLERDIGGNDLLVYGDGMQTRDLLYVEDCADFIYQASCSQLAIGEVINGGTGFDISVLELAKIITKDHNKIKHVKHIHPQSEIQKLVCDNRKAIRILNWYPKTQLIDGIEYTRQWLLK